MALRLVVNRCEPFAVHVGGLEQRDAERDRPFDDAVLLGFRDRAVALAGEPPGPERKLRNFETSFPEPARARMGVAYSRPRARYSYDQ